MVDHVLNPRISGTSLVIYDDRRGSPPISPTPVDVGVTSEKAPFLISVEGPLFVTLYVEDGSPTDIGPYVASRGHVLGVMSGIPYELLSIGPFSSLVVQ